MEITGQTRDVTEVPIQNRNGTANNKEWRVSLTFTVNTGKARSIKAKVCAFLRYKSESALHEGV